MNYGAITIFGSAKCTLECTYCYIKKTKELKEIDKEVIKQLADPKLPEGVSPNNVRTISIWGGEPTLHLDILCENIDKYKKLYPNLDNFSVSSNMTYTKHFEVFAKMLAENKFKLSLQISDDGGDNNITNRGLNPNILQRNSLKIIQTLVDNKVDFIYSFKPTLSSEEFEELTENDTKFYNFFKYFDEFGGKINKIIGNDSPFNKQPVAGTVICPGTYTKKDGVILSNYLHKVVDWLRSDKLHFDNIFVSTSYGEAWKQVVDRFNTFTQTPFTFTCSAGDSNIQLDTYGGIHPCHRTLYFVYDDHLDTIRDMDFYENDDVDYLSSGMIELYQKYYKMDNKKKMLHMRSYHDHYQLRFASTTASIMELADCGQIDKIYLDRKKAELFSIFLNTTRSCSVENFFVTGSWHLMPLTVIRVFGNGAFELINEFAFPNLRKDC